MKHAFESDQPRTINSAAIVDGNSGAGGGYQDNTGAAGVGVKNSTGVRDGDSYIWIDRPTSGLDVSSRPLNIGIKVSN